MDITFEYKIRFRGDGRPWEEIPVTENKTIWVGVSTDRTWELAKAYAYAMAREPYDWKNIVEIRYNEKGSYQGHYVKF